MKKNILNNDAEQTEIFFVIEALILSEKMRDKRLTDMEQDQVEDLARNLYPKLYKMVEEGEGYIKMCHVANHILDKHLSRIDIEQVQEHHIETQNAVTENPKVVEVSTVSELLSGHLSRCRPFFLHEGLGNICIDYYDKETDDGSNSNESRVLTLWYKAPYETEADIKRLGEIEATIETLLYAVNRLNILGRLKGSPFV